MASGGVGEPSNKHQQQTSSVSELFRQHRGAVVVVCVAFIAIGMYFYIQREPTDLESIHRRLEELKKKTILLSDLKQSIEDVTRKITKLKGSAVEEISKSKTSAIQDIERSRESALNDISKSKTSAKQDIEHSSDSALKQISKRREDSTTDIQDLARTSKESIESLVKSSTGEIEQQTTDSQSRIDDSRDSSLKQIQANSEKEQNDISKLSENSKDDISKLSESSTTNLNTLTSESSENINSGRTKSLSEIENLNKRVNEELSVLREHSESSIRELRKDSVAKINALKEEINQLRGKSVDEITALTNGLPQKNELAELTGKSAIVDKMRLQVVNKDALIFIIVIIFVVEIVLGVMVYQMRCPTGSYRSDSGQSSVRYMDAKEVLSAVPRAPRLENAVGVISFHESQTVNYLRLLQTAVPDPKLDVRPYFINRHHNICDLPRCSLYIMCVEFTERHIIIEEEGFCLGDLKLTTYKAVKQLGGALAIIYAQDYGSRQLDPNALYNTNIYCAGNQPELIELSTAGRFLSVYDSLTNIQKQRLNEIVKETIRQ